jgi:hypothetical protein
MGAQNVISLSLAALSAVCVLGLFRELYKDRRLIKEGTETEGVLTARRKSVYTRGRSYFVTYSFIVRSSETGEIMTYAREQEIAPAHFQDLQQNQPLQVKYLPSNPRISRLTAEAQDPTRYVRMIMYAALFAFGSIAIHSPIFG